jgi:putative heme-binding domain-containing protein
MAIAYHSCHIEGQSMRLSLICTSVGFLAMAMSTSGADTARERVGIRWPEPVQCEALRTLAHADAPGTEDETAKFILAKWSTFTPAVRRCAARTIAERAVYAREMLSSLTSGAIPPWTLTGTEQQQVIARARGQERARLESLFSPEAARSSALRATYASAVDRRGNVTAGQTQYENLCARCHPAPGMTGVPIGPPLAALRALPPAQIVRDILLPSHSIREGYESYSFALMDRVTQVGVLVGQTDTTLTLRVGTREVVVQRRDITRFSVVPLSAMPEGLASLLDASQMADLVTFVVSTR